MKLKNLLRHGHYLATDDNPQGIADGPVEDTPAPPDSQPANEPWRDELNSIRGEFGEIKGMLQGLVSRQSGPDPQNEPAPDEYPDEWEQQFSSRIKESVRKDTSQIVATEVRAALSEVLTLFQVQQAIQYLGGDAAKKVLGNASEGEILHIVNNMPELAEMIREKTGANKPRTPGIRTTMGGDYPENDAPTPQEMQAQTRGLQNHFSPEAIKALNERKRAR